MQLETEIRQKAFHRNVLKRLHPDLDSQNNEEIRLESVSKDSEQCSHVPKMYTVVAPPPGVSLEALASQQEEFVREGSISQPSSCAESDDDAPKGRRPRKRGKRITKTEITRAKKSDDSEINLINVTSLESEGHPLTKNQKRKLKKKRRKAKSIQEVKQEEFFYVDNENSDATTAPQHEDPSKTKTHLVIQELWNFFDAILDVYEKEVKGKNRIHSDPDEIRRLIEVIFRQTLHDDNHSMIVQCIQRLKHQLMLGVSDSLDAISEFSTQNDLPADQSRALCELSKYWLSDVCSNR